MLDPVTASVVVGRPREEVFEYLADIANHAEFTDHWMKDWHLTRVDSYGRGAGARFHTARKGERYAWADMTFIEERPHRRQVENRGYHDATRTWARASPGTPRRTRGNWDVP